MKMLPGNVGYVVVNQMSFPAVVDAMLEHFKDTKAIIFK